MERVFTAFSVLERVKRLGMFSMGEDSPVLSAQVTSTNAEVDLIPHFMSSDGKAQSMARWIKRSSDSIKYAVWQAEEGAYTSPGGDYVETFVVTHGRGKVIIHDAGEFPLEPGSIVVIPPKVSSTIVVAAPFRKFVVFEPIA